MGEKIIDWKKLIQYELMGLYNESEPLNENWINKVRTLLEKTFFTQQRKGVKIKKRLVDDIIDSIKARDGFNPCIEWRNRVEKDFRKVVQLQHLKKSEEG